MLNVVKDLKGNTLTAKLAGAIEENVNFDQLIGPPPANLIVNCKEVSRINSVGVKAWIKYFMGFQGKSTVKFQECSTAIVEQVNLISNFTCGGEVESIYVPFSCVNCKSQLVGLFSCADLRKMEMKVPELKCTKCGNKAIFDDIPEEYFGFLNK